MNIAFLTSEFPHPRIGNSGGIGTSIYNLSKGLVALGHVVILIVYAQKEDTFFIENNISFYLIKNIKFKGFSLFLTQKKIGKLINKLVADQKIDILEAPEWTGITSFIKPNCPVIIRLHGSDTYFCHLEERPVKWINKFHEKRALKNADGLISVSQFTAEVTQKIFNLKKEFTIIPNGIDLKVFSNTDKKHTIDNPTILYFGTIIRKKGLLELPFIFNEVFKENTKAKLILVGKDGADIISGNKSTWQMMQPLFSSEALLNVSYLGSIPYQEIKSNINEATVCVFPTFAETFGMVTIEAMALQKPIVASNIGWATEVIDDNVNGFLEHPKNHKQFANKILRLLSSVELQNQLGVEARKKVELQFTIEVITKKSLDLYKSVID